MSASLPGSSGPSALKVCPVCGARYELGAKFCQFDGEALVIGTEQDDPYIGRTLLDQFRIEEVLGAGGMGTVYRAHQRSVDRNVAIKILHPELIKNPDAVRRFKREAKVSTALDHPNIVRVYLFGQLPDDSLYLVMEYLQGRSLGAVLRDETPIELGRSLRILLQLCDGIGDAHHHGVVHRDVKPENIFLVRRAGEPDFVKVLDFGIARFLKGEQTALTQSGLIFGTARYISPEGAAGEPTDARSDVYSIGVLAYQLLSGAPPFKSKSPVSLLMKHIHDKPVPLRNRPDGSRVPERIGDLVMRCLSKNPEIRPDDARELALALEEAAEAEGLGNTLPGRRFSSSGRGSGALVPTRDQRMPPVGALAAAEPARVAPLSSPSQNAVLYRDPARPPVEQQHTLARAPSPFGSEEFRVPGLYKPSRKKLLLLLAIMAAAAVVTVTAVASVRFLAESRDDAQIGELENRIRVALVRGHYDRPPDDNVLELTEALLELSPGHGPALRYREEAAHRLEQEAVTAKRQGFDAEAHALFERALVLDPTNRVANAALETERREQEAVAPVPVEEPASPLGLELSPSRSIETGEPLRIRFRGRSEAAAVAFLIQSRGRTLRRLVARRTEEGLFESSYLFRSAGRYTVAVEGLEAEAEVVVRRSTSPRPQSSPFRVPTAQPSATMRTPTTMNPDSDDGIDWSLPGTRRPVRPAVVSRPLAPSEMGAASPSMGAAADMSSGRPNTGMSLVSPGMQQSPPAPWTN